MSQTKYDEIITASLNGRFPSHQQSLALANCTDNARLIQAAGQLRDQGFGNVLTYSRKVFLPITTLCRDVCHYCTFAKTPRHIQSVYMSEEDVLTLARQGAEMGCKEALFTLGEKPELRYSAAREALQEMGFTSTLEYVVHIAQKVLTETGLLPHINAGNMTAEEIDSLRKVSASMGIMLESASERLCEKGMPHYGSPDKLPAQRLDTIRLAGRANVPFTSGILIGIGETRKERIESLLALRELNTQYGHLQEIIIQNFRAKADTKMAQHSEPTLDDLVWTIAVARIIFGSHMSIQAPPNLSPDDLSTLVDAGINDWGGVSPLTPDHVNPEAPWPQVMKLSADTERAGKYLDERLTVYPQYALNKKTWLSPELHTSVLRLMDAQGYARSDFWLAGGLAKPPQALINKIKTSNKAPQINAVISTEIEGFVEQAVQGKRLNEEQIARLFSARGEDFHFICQAADKLRVKVNGDVVTYVVNRNINYTNICYFKCTFCAFSKGKSNKDLRGKPYDLADSEIQRRVKEAAQRGATEVCLQGGIHPHYTGEKYLEIIKLIKQVDADMHIHAFSPLEVWQGASTLGISIKEFLQKLKDAGLDTLPGTAAEILDDDVRQILCPDKINSAQWLDVIKTAHQTGFKTTATIMFGHVDDYLSWGRHLLAIRDLQEETGGFTEFVPLSFVASEAPLYRKGLARKGPTFRESILMHAIARIVFHGLIDNIQVSWVKMGPEGVAASLYAGVNDLGGVLMDESITRAAGAQHGQEFNVQRMQALIGEANRTPQQRTTLYQPIEKIPERVLTMKVG